MWSLRAATPERPGRWVAWEMDISSQAVGVGAALVRRPLPVVHSLTATQPSFLARKWDMVLGLVMLAPWGWWL